MQLQNNIYDQKIKLIFYSILICSSIIVLKLIHLQIHLTDKLFGLSKKNFTRVIKVSSTRGNIIDTNGHLLATNRPIINIYWAGTGNKELKSDQLNIIENLQKIINKDLLNDIELQKFKISEKFCRRLLVSSDISFEQLSQISEQFSSCPNIYIETKFQRFYPQNSCASHVVGYLGNMDLESIGKMGLEKIFENDLKGEPGTAIAKINSFGKHLSLTEIKPALSGQTIQTTIDLHLQKIAEKIFPKEYNGSLIIMDPKTGALRVILSRPDFEPQIFLKQLTQQDWNDLQEKKPLLNRAFNACYPPASIFKLITTTAALDLGIVHQDSKWNCQGSITFGERQYFCKKRTGHGVITIKEAVAKSCNTFFYEIGKHIDIDTIASYARKFGLGQKTGIIFAEKSGLIPTSEWKMRIHGERWWSGETLSVAIGQSFLLTTPIQIARMQAGIFEGYLVNPRILESEPIEKNPLNVKREILEFLRQSMRFSVETGTGQRVNKINNINVYAKTGTAQTCSLGKEEMGKEYLEHTWFVSNFSYKNSSPLVMVILLENTGSKTTVVNTARQFLLEYRDLMKLKTEEKEEN